MSRRPNASAMRRLLRLSEAADANQVLVDTFDLCDRLSARTMTVRAGIDAVQAKIAYLHAQHDLMLVTLDRAYALDDPAAITAETLDATTDEILAEAIRHQEAWVVLDELLASLVQWEDTTRDLRAMDREPPAPEPPPMPRLPQGGLCTTCGRRPRHFDTYCKRCVPAHLRPTGKVA